MATQTLNETQQTITKALDALKLFGRARGALIDDEGQFCPLQALSFARTGDTVGLGFNAYTDTKDVVAVAQAFYERFNQSDEFTLEDFKAEGRKHSWIHAYNDETADDDLIFSLMQRGIEIAGEQS